MLTSLLILNLAASLASAAWAAIALVRPATLSGSSHVSRGEIFYVRMYAARSIPLGLATAILPFCFAGDAVACLLFVAAAIQAGDIMVAVGKKERKMIVGASLASVVHILCGLAVL